MNDFTYAYPTKQYFGVNALKRAFDAELSKYGENVMLAYGKNAIKENGIYNEIMDMLKNHRKEIFEFSGIMPNPTYKKVQNGADFAKKNKIDFILAVGGGSVMDCCKIISSQACTDEDIWEMEFSKGKFPVKQLPMGVIVTASGTGGEYNLSDDINEAVMKSVIKNIRAVILNHTDTNARGELIWASAIAENGMLKIGKTTDFQAHQIEHQLGAYTDCNHGQGLAVIHPVLYRHIYKKNIKKFAQFAVNVWDIEKTDKTDAELAFLGIDALADFIKEIGLPSSFSEMKMDKNTDFRAIAESTNTTAGCCAKLTHEEILEILNECY